MLCCGSNLFITFDRSIDFWNKDFNVRLRRYCREGEGGGEEDCA